MRRASVIPPGLSFVGDVSGDEDLVVFGQVEGDVRLGGSLVVERGATIRGEVRAHAVTVRGVVVGDVFGAESIRVEPDGRMVGDLTAPRVKIVPGGLFRGQLHMDTDGVSASVRGRPSSPPPAAPEVAAAAEAEVAVAAPDGAPQAPPTAAPPPAAPVRTRASGPGPRSEAETVPGSVRARSGRAAPRPRLPALGRSRGQRKEG